LHVAVNAGDPGERHDARQVEGVETLSGDVGLDGEGHRTKAISPAPCVRYVDGPPSVQRRPRLPGQADVSDRTLSRARAGGSYRLLDESLSIADGVQSKNDVPAARLQVSARQFVIEKWNAAELGQKAGASLTLNVTQLHLAALQAVSNSAVPAEKVTGALEGAEDKRVGLLPPASQHVIAPSISELE
jgi:hypothetical protein